ncbi:hypothetical protein ACS0TY_003062 [Phlomoides rotata]
MDHKKNNFILFLLICVIFTSFFYAGNANDPDPEVATASVDRPPNQFWSLILPSLVGFFLPPEFTINFPQPTGVSRISDDETSFSYVIGAPNGPYNWTNLNPNWTRCGTGRTQSPINIVNLTISSRGNSIRRYRPAPAQIRNRGHDIEVVWIGDAGGIVVNGIEFKLGQCHWHIPSEHTVNSRRYNMELHLVHYSAERDIAVVGILYTLGRADPFLTQLAPFIRSATRNATNIGIVNPSNIGFEGRKYYRYNGSLTTPPCSENVTWTILKEVRTVSLKQITALRNAVDDGITGNARPIQALNGRPVYMFKSDWGRGEMHPTQ